MGKVDHADDAVNHRIADGDEPVDGPERQPIDELLEEILQNETPYVLEQKIPVFPGLPKGLSNQTDDDKCYIAQIWAVPNVEAGRREAVQQAISSKLALATYIKLSYIEPQYIALG